MPVEDGAQMLDLLMGAALRFELCDPAFQAAVDQWVVLGIPVAASALVFAAAIEGARRDASLPTFAVTNECPATFDKHHEYGEIVREVVAQVVPGTANDPCFPAGSNWDRSRRHF